MSISGKELAKKLGISESSVSVALNNRPGVSNELRKKVLQAAQKYGYDFSKVTPEKESPSSISKNILLIRYIGQSVLSTEIAYFSRIIQGIDSACKNYNCLVNIFYLYEGPDFYQQLETAVASLSWRQNFRGPNTELFSTSPFLLFFWIPTWKISNMTVY